MNSRNLRYLVEYWLFRTLVCVLQALSPRAAARLAETLACLVFRVLPRKLTRYGVARENLRIAFGDALSERQADRIIFRMWVHLFRLIGEIVQLPRKLRLHNYRACITFAQERSVVVRALCSDRPVILLSGHYGNWEMLMWVFGLFGFPMSVVARPLDNPYLDAWFLRFRRSSGHDMLGKKGAFLKMSAVLERGGTLACLADQDAGPRGTFVEFFGRPASTFPTIARLAVEHNAYVVVGYSRRLADDFERRHWVHYELGNVDVIDPGDYHGEDRVERITQRFTTSLERAVRLAPEQYFWVHRRWKTTPADAAQFCRDSSKAA